MKWSAVALIAVVIGVVGIALLARLDSRQSRSSQDSSSPLTATRASGLATELRSGVPAEFADAVALPPGVTLAPRVESAFSRLRSVEFDSASFRLTQPGVAAGHVTIVTAAGATQRWNVTLVMSDTTWKLAATALVPS